MSDSSKTSFAAEEPIVLGQCKEEQPSQRAGQEAELKAIKATMKQIKIQEDELHACVDRMRAQRAYLSQVYRKAALNPKNEYYNDYANQRMGLAPVTAAVNSIVESLDMMEE